MAALLEVEGLEAGYGKKTVLQGVSFRVDEGEVVALLGHNGIGQRSSAGGQQHARTDSRPAGFARGQGHG